MSVCILSIYTFSVYTCMDTCMHMRYVILDTLSAAGTCMRAIQQPLRSMEILPRPCSTFCWACMSASRSDPSTHDPLIMIFTLSLHLFVHQCVHLFLRLLHCWFVHSSWKFSPWSRVCTILSGCMHEVLLIWHGGANAHPVAFRSHLRCNLIYMYLIHKGQASCVSVWSTFEVQPKVRGQ